MSTQIKKKKRKFRIGVAVKCRQFRQPTTSHQLYTYGLVIGYEIINNTLQLQVLESGKIKSFRTGMCEIISKPWGKYEI